MSDQKYFNFSEFLKDIDEKQYIIVKRARGSGKTEFLEQLVESLDKQLIEERQKNRVLKLRLNTVYGKFGDINSLYPDISLEVNKTLSDSNRQLREEVATLKQELERANEKLYKIQEITKCS